MTRETQKRKQDSRTSSVHTHRHYISKRAKPIMSPQYRKFSFPVAKVQHIINIICDKISRMFNQLYKFTKIYSLSTDFLLLKNRALDRKSPLSFRDEKVHLLSIGILKSTM